MAKSDDWRVQTSLSTAPGSSEYYGGSDTYFDQLALLHPRQPLATQGYYQGVHGKDHGGGGALGCRDGIMGHSREHHRVSASLRTNLGPAGHEERPTTRRRAQYGHYFLKDKRSGEEPLLRGDGPVKSDVVSAGSSGIFVKRNDNMKYT